MNEAQHVFNNRKNSLFSHAVLFITILLIYLASNVFYKIIPALMPFKNRLRDLVIIISIFVSYYFYFIRKTQHRFFQKHLLLILCYYSFLVLESMFKYRHPMIYPNIILFLSSVFYVTFFCAISMRFLNPSLLLRRIAFIYGGTICGYMVLVRFFKVLPVMTNAYYRTISSHTTLFLVFLVIFLLYKFFQKPSLFMLPIMLFCFIVIVTESHRSVWLAAITALLMSSLLVLRNKNSRLKIKNFWLVACMLISFLLILSYGQNIKYLDFLTTRLDDVYKFSYIYGTGMFRYRQYEHYLPYIMNNFFLGMRFSGFELPALYRAWSGDWSGHLFHSGYLNIFFYHGLFGFYLLYSPALYYIFKVLSLKTYGSDVITVTSFVAACIVYSLAYQPDIIFFALLGVGFALLETEQKNIEHGTGAM